MKEYHIFYAPDISTTSSLPADEANHAIRVLRMKEGDGLQATDGKGKFYECTISMSSRTKCLLQIKREYEVEKPWKGLIQLVVAPTKNIDRIEWLAEKATEIGFDKISFINCKNSERRIIKNERIERIVVSAMKQSHKAWKPIVEEMTTFDDFIKKPFDGQRFIAHCYDMDNNNNIEDNSQEAMHTRYLPELINANQNSQILIGPEGDFSIDEVEKALSCGFIPISLGKSRLRTETAALVGVHLLNIAKMQ